MQIKSNFKNNNIIMKKKAIYKLNKKINLLSNLKSNKFKNQKIDLME